jgi:hypothetical protein
MCEGCLLKPQEIITPFDTIAAEPGRRNSMGKRDSSL